jgi:hypothetical protein
MGLINLIRDKLPEGAIHNHARHWVSKKSNGIHIFDTKAQREKRETHQGELRDQRNDYSSKYGLFSGRGYRKEQKIDAKSQISQQKLDFKQWQKQKKMQDKMQHPWHHRFSVLLKYIVLPLFIVYLLFLSSAYDFWNFVEREDYIGQAEEELVDSGIQHQFNIVGQVLSGEFNPEDLWSSEAVKSEYAAPEDFEIFLEDIGPRKDVYIAGDAIEIGGRINLISGFDKTTTVTLGVKPNKLCTEATKSQFKDWLNIDSDKGDCTSSAEWDCFISGSDEKNVFEMARIYNRQFYCRHPGTGLNVDETEVISGIDVTWSYATSAVAGKQIYVFKSDIVGKYKDPINQYSISKDSLTSWYIGDEQINLGIGLSQDAEYVRTEESIDNLYDKDLFDAVNYLGVTLQNIGGGEITGIESLSVSFPEDSGLLVAREIKNVDTGEIVFVGPTTEVISVRGQNIITKKFSLSEEEISKFKDIKQSNRQNYYIPFIVDESYVGASAFRSFLVKTEIRYVYEDNKATTVTVEP